MKPRLSPILLVLAVSACATKVDSSAAGSRNLITAEEIQESGALTAYEAIRILRPRFLRPGRFNVKQSAYPVVYVDDLRLGGIDELRRIRSGDVHTILYLSGPDATTRFGTGHSGGALLVTTGGSVGSGGGARAQATSTGAEQHRASSGCCTGSPRS